MKKYENICWGCFKAYLQNGVCPNCGYSIEHQDDPLILSPGTVLNGHYIVGRILGVPGGFGITYLAIDVHLEICVAIKEYLHEGVMINFQ